MTIAAPTCPIILLLGPTASGKTDLAMELHSRIPVEIISVDSAMVYRGMDIGSGKPTPEQLKLAPHHLINIRNPQEPYSAAEFCQDAIQLIHQSRAAQRIPLLVGGSMLYFRALLQGLSPLPSANPEIRVRLSNEAENLGWQAMHYRLSIIDPKAALRIHPNDPQRIQRALEIYEVTGRTQSSFWEESQSGWGLQSLDFHESQDSHECKSREQNLIIFVILPKNRQLLHERIQQRFHRMLEQGFMDEVQVLYQSLQSGNLQLSLPALRSVGYRQALQYLAGECSYDEMVSRAIAATRQLAKRQITWLRSLFKTADREETEYREDIKDRTENNTENQTENQTDNGENKVKNRIHFLDIENNHLDSLTSVLHCLAQRGVRVNNP